MLEEIETPKCSRLEKYRGGSEKDGNKLCTVNRKLEIKMLWKPSGAENREVDENEALMTHSVSKLRVRINTRVCRRHACDI